MAVGKRIYLQRNLPDPKIVEAFGKLPAANVADVMNRNCGMHPRIKLLSKPTKQMVGPAFTVKNRPGDNLAIHAALNYIHEGDVLVISNEGENSRSLIGAIMINYLFFYKKIAGMVVDGPIRDIDTVGEYDCSIYANGFCPGGPYKEGPGEVNVPVACGGVSVNPGDIILGDADGVIVIPRNDAAGLLPACQEFATKDHAKTEAAKTGATNRDWVEKLLKAKDFEIIDGVYRP